MTDFEPRLREIAKGAQRAVDQNSSWVWRLFAMVLTVAAVWWFKRQMAKKEAELARASSELQRTKLKADSEAFKAECARLDAEAIQRYRVAQERAAKALDAAAADEQRFAALKATVQKIENWEDLNAIAGVKP